MSSLIINYTGWPIVGLRLLSHPVLEKSITTKYFSAILVDGIDGKKMPNPIETISKQMPYNIAHFLTSIGFIYNTVRKSCWQKHELCWTLF